MADLHGCKDSEAHQTWAYQPDPVPDTTENPPERCAMCDLIEARNYGRRSAKALEKVRAEFDRVHKNQYICDLPLGDTPDAQGDVIAPGAFRDSIERFMVNPVVLSSERKIMGRVLEVQEVEPSEARITVRIEFAPECPAEILDAMVKGKLHVEPEFVDKGNGEYELLSVSVVPV
jgi:hypothetical protein